MPTSQRHHPSLQRHHPWQKHHPLQPFTELMLSFQWSSSSTCEEYIPTHVTPWFKFGAELVNMWFTKWKIRVSATRKVWTQFDVGY